MWLESVCSKSDLVKNWLWCNLRIEINQLGGHGDREDSNKSRAMQWLCSKATLLENKTNETPP